MLKDDAVHLDQRNLVTVTGGKLTVGDMDGDGTIIDATAIQRYLASLSSNENIGKPKN